VPKPKTKENPKKGFAKQSKTAKSKKAKNKRRKKRVVWLILSAESIVRKLAKDLNIDSRCREYALRRLSQEGIPFLTVTLPRFAKYALRCCDAGEILCTKAIRCEFSCFQWRKRSPVFLLGLLERAVRGCAVSLRSIRQFCEYFYKTAFGFSKAQLEKAESDYLDRDESLGLHSLCLDRVERGRKAFLKLFPKLCGHSLKDIMERYPTGDGPGAFARSGRFAHAYDVPMEVFKKLPMARIGTCRKSLNGVSGYFKSYPSSPEKIRLVNEPKVAELMFVPKDSRGPRTISKEPYFLLKGQKPFGSFLCDQLERESHNHVNFSDQTINQKLCVTASIDRQMATLDLKDASDRVSVQLVQRLTAHVPLFRFLLKNLRTTHVTTPSGLKHELRKFANMGSNLCFPVLALVVYIAGVLGVDDYYHRGIKHAAGKVYVYGDDLIVPSCCVTYVMRSLEDFGLKVNQDKSYYSGNFRESCGADYYHGVSVAPVRLRLSGENLKEPTKYRNGFIPLKAEPFGKQMLTDAAGILQLEKHCREAVDGGLLSLADYYYQKLEGLLGTLPIGSKETSVLCRYKPWKTPSFVPEKAWRARTLTFEHQGVCGYKGLGKALTSHEGLGEDWESTPLRHQILITTTVARPADLHGYGLTENPHSLFNY